MSQPQDPSGNKPATSTELPQPCVGGCGFYGSPDQHGCCSVCFKKMYPDAAPSQPKTITKPAPPSTSSSDKSANETESKQDETPKVDDKEKQNKPKKKVQKKKNRCWQCRKKMTLAGQFECKCGYTFCSLHRFPDAHSCEFTEKLKQQHKDKLAKDNQTVAFAKFEKI